MKMLHQIINNFSGALIPEMSFVFEGGYDYIYIPANKNKYITYEYKTKSAQIPQFNEQLFNKMLNNPKSVVD